MRVQVDTYNYAELMIIDFSSIIYTAGLTPDQRLSSEMTKSRSFSEVFILQEKVSVHYYRSNYLLDKMVE